MTNVFLFKKKLYELNFSPKSNFYLVYFHGIRFTHELCNKVSSGDVGTDLVKSLRDTHTNRRRGRRILDFEFSKTEPKSSRESKCPNRNSIGFFRVFFPFFFVTVPARNLFFHDGPPLYRKRIVMVRARGRLRETL